MTVSCAYIQLKVGFFSALSLSLVTLSNLCPTITCETVVEHRPTRARHHSYVTHTQWELQPTNAWCKAGADLHTTKVPMSRANP